MELEDQLIGAGQDHERQLHPVASNQNVFQKVNASLNIRRYNDEGEPVEVMLVDLQMNRLASPALDLSYMMFCSLSGDVRRANMDHFMSSYYDSFSAVIESGGKAQPYTLPELHQEYQNRLEFGVLFSILVLVVILSEGSDIPDMSSFSEEEIPLRIQEWKERTLRMMENNSQFRSRFLGVFDDFIIKLAKQ